MVLAVCTQSEVVSHDGSFGEFINKRNLQGEIVAQTKAAHSLSVLLPINTDQRRTEPE